MHFVFNVLRNARPSFKKDIVSIARQREGLYNNGYKTDIKHQTSYLGKKYIIPRMSIFLCE